MAHHTFLYKILDGAPESPLPDTLPATDLDLKDGFIHLSTASQTPSTADLFFAQCSKLWILKLRSKDLDGNTRHPPELGGGCAHVHDSQIGLGQKNVESVIEVEKDHASKWSSVSVLLDLED